MTEKGEDIMTVDLWYGDKLKDIDGADCYFYPNEGIYRGNLYKGNKCVGDYSSTDSCEIEKKLPITFKD